MRPTTESHRPRRASVPLLALACLLLPAALSAQTDAPDPVPEPETVPERRVLYGDRISIFSGDVFVPENVERRGAITCVGCNVTIEGVVTRDVVVVLGSLEVTGSVEGAVINVLSDARFEGARAGRELISILGTLELIDSEISRDLVSVLTNFESVRSIVGNQFVLPGIGLPSGKGIILWFRLFWLFIAFALLLLLAALIPERIQVIAGEAPVRYLSAFFVGILGYLGMLIMVGLLAATVIGIPLAIVGFWVMQWMGVAGIFYAIGHRFGRSFGADLSVLGAVLLTFTLYALIKLSPTPLGFWGLGLSVTIWLLFFFLVQLPAIGLVILTRFGTRAGAKPAAVSSPAPTGTYSPGAPGAWVSPSDPSVSAPSTESPPWSRPPAAGPAAPAPDAGEPGPGPDADDSEKNRRESD